MARFLLKTLSASLATCLFVTNSLFAHVPETSVWAERRKASRSSVQLARLPAAIPNSRIFNPQQIPISKVQFQKIDRPDRITSTLELGALAPYGSVRKVITPSSGKNDRVVIHIQDIHLNVEAQSNINNAVQALINQRKVNLVALEGAFEPIDLSDFRRFPYQDSVKAVADYLLLENKISGAVHAGFTAKADLPPFVGVDDKAHYDANVDAYKRSAPNVSEATKRLAVLEQRLTQEKSQSFSRELARFDAGVQAYREARMSWGAYVRFLCAQPTAKPAPGVKNLLTALAEEARLDFQRVEIERTELLKQLLSKLTPEETQDLLARSEQYRAGALNHAQFYAVLTSLCGQHGISLARYKAMDAYIRYVLLAEQLDVEELTRDITRLEGALYDSLATSDAEKNLVRRSRELFLTRKLVNFSLTKEEWGEYKTAVHGPWTMDHRQNLSSFERFYEQAEARDEAMAGNLLRALEQTNAKVTVLVTGGFHSEGIDERLRRDGFTTISYIPKITKVDSGSGSRYLTVFTQEKTPLDKLFAGEKLFLPPHVMVPAAPAQVFVAGHAAAQHSTPLIVSAGYLHEIHQDATLTTSPGGHVQITIADVIYSFVVDRSGDIHRPSANVSPKPPPVGKEIFSQCKAAASLIRPVLIFLLSPLLSILIAGAVFAPPTGLPTAAAQFKAERGLSVDVRHPDTKKEEEYAQRADRVWKLIRANLDSCLFAFAGMSCSS